jgi:FAD/FMN-containing dehydrogenase
MDSVFPKGSRGYWKNLSFSRMDDAAVDVLVGFASEVTWFGTGIDIHHMEGAFGRVPEEATAFPNRAAKYWLNIYGFWHDPEEDERLSAFARKAYALMQPFGEHGEYVNFLGAEIGQDVIEAARQAYGQDTYDRLVALKNRFDPHNLFRLNHNIVPTSA